MYVIRYFENKAKLREFKLSKFLDSNIKNHKYVAVFKYVSHFTIRKEYEIVDELSENVLFESINDAVRIFEDRTTYIKFGRSNKRLYMIDKLSSEEENLCI